MPNFTHKIRSLGSIRTHGSARTSAATETHTLYMKQTAIEIERARRIEERRCLLERLATVETRIAVLTDEQVAIAGHLKQREQMTAFEPVTGPKANRLPQGKVNSTSTFSY